MSEYYCVLNLDVNEAVLARALEQFNPLDPLVIAHIGCGRHWKYDQRSANGTKPRESGFGPDKITCPRVHLQGGICGGSGVVWSRGAIEKFFSSVRLQSAKLDPQMQAYVTARFTPLTLSLSPLLITLAILRTPERFWWWWRKSC